MKSYNQFFVGENRSKNEQYRHRSFFVEYFHFTSSLAANKIPTCTGTAATYGSASGTTSAVPFTWTTSDYIEILGTYPII